jgi:hypothetical protein
MALQHQPPPPIYAQQFQLCTPDNQRGSSHCTGSGRGRGYQNPGYQQPTGAPPMCVPMPYKQFKNWHYCHTHGGDVDNTNKRDVCQAWSSSQLASLLHHHNGQFDGRHAQDYLAVGLQPCPTRCTRTTDQAATRPSGLAAPPATCQLHAVDGGDASTGTIPSHLPHGTATYQCGPAPASFGQRDGALPLPSATGILASTSLLTVRGEQN